MALLQIPTIDLSPFLNADENGKKNVIEKIKQACSEYGFFQITNHGICQNLINQALQVSNTFFKSPDEEKLKFRPKPDSPLPVGYSRKLNPEYEFNEYLLMLPPNSDFNVFPTNPPELREVMKEMFSQFTKTASIVEDILCESLGLPQSILKELNDDRSFDLLIALYYLPANEKEKMGTTPHKDVSCFTMVLQDDVAGLEVEKDGQWVPLPPTPGALVVNLGDVLQVKPENSKVLTNGRFKSATHRVLRPEGKSRRSFAFFHNLSANKWLEPLPEFTREIGEKAKYKKFLFKEYQQLRKQNKTNNSIARLEDEFNISYYAIN